ncbi:hypothetical protein [uncultured Holdemanella sp.]|nr:hypothetical protein [uncultured Holdemanella sp.]
MTKDRLNSNSSSNAICVGSILLTLKGLEYLHCLVFVLNNVQAIKSTAKS